MAAAAENEDNVSEQRRQHGKRVRYGEVVQVHACTVHHVYTNLPMGIYSTWGLVIPYYISKTTYNS